MVAELVLSAKASRRRLHELAMCQETVMIHFRASKGVPLRVEFDKVRGQLNEKVLLVTKNHHNMHDGSARQPGCPVRRRLHELAMCQETVMIYFRASKGVPLRVEFDKARGQLNDKLLLVTKNHHSLQGGRARTFCQSCQATIARACHVPGDGRDTFPREQRCSLEGGIRQSGRSTK